MFLGSITIFLGFSHGFPTVSEDYPMDIPLWVMGIRLENSSQPEALCHRSNFRRFCKKNGYDTIHIQYTYVYIIYVIHFHAPGLFHAMGCFTWVSFWHICCGKKNLFKSVFHLAIAFGLAVKVLESTLFKPCEFKK